MKTFLHYLICIAWMQLSINLFAQDKMKGISLVGSRDPISIADISPLIEINANWVTLMPFGFIKDKEIKFNIPWQWWGEREEGIRETIDLCKNNGLKVMLKPQVWIPDGYTGDFKLSKENDWRIFESSYREFILFFLEIAEELEVELFCIGTEWKSFIAARPDFWNRLIREAKSIYKYQLTYAANWDDFQKVYFWDELDYIGVNAYFPISFRKNPAQVELLEGWKIHRKRLSEFSHKNKKQIIFTEIGYRSLKGATVKPWEFREKGAYASQIQVRAYEAFFEEVWSEDWLKGMFVWKWYINHPDQGGRGNIDFTPQNKPAEKVIRDSWAQ
ncbi:glycoside hydrolase family 113 [Crocinitomix algicola]|uniref:glycoside hydrolase family 113 n=1 Tax=Crocinitomix algicola TaxID=1740263 RepID=UPI00082AA175|nr:hypothetical protein [Crocinitomix algicola]